MVLWAQAGIYTGYNSVSPFPLVMKTGGPRQGLRPPLSLLPKPVVLRGLY